MKSETQILKLIVLIGLQCNHVVFSAKAAGLKPRLRQQQPLQPKSPRLSRHFLQVEGDHQSSLLNKQKCLSNIFPCSCQISAARLNLLNPSPGEANTHGSFLDKSRLKFLFVPQFIAFCCFQLHPSFGFSPSLAGQNFLPNLPRVREQDQLSRTTKVC